MNSTKKAPPKLSPQEQRIMSRLLKDRRASVRRLFCDARQLPFTMAPSNHRKMQQHVGVIIARINKKRRKFVIVPGGKSTPRTYRITRRR